jgi:FkbM family methyltransferase
MSFESLVKEFDLCIKGVLHIGAHWGEEEPFYTKHGVKDMIFFEPIARNYEMLLDMLPKNERIVAHKIALGNEEGMVWMFTETANRGQSCSVLEPIKHLTQYPHIKFEDKEMVEIKKLDSVQFDRTLYNMINIVFSNK